MLTGCGAGGRRAFELLVVRAGGNRASPKGNRRIN